MLEPRNEPLPGQKINAKEAPALVCKHCGVALEALGLCKNCKNYNLPARGREYLLIKPDEFGEVTISQNGPNLNFSSPDAVTQHMTIEEIDVLGNENVELGKIVFAFWFQANKNLFPRQERPTVREIRDYLDELVSQRKWQ